MKDTFKTQGMRKRLVKDLQAKGIHDLNVLKAIENVPRHYFFETAFLKQAYEDNAFPIGEGQTISQPFTVAYQTQLLQVKFGDKILELGTGSGYQACILAEMGAKVYTIERIKALYLKAKEMFNLLGYKPMVVLGDGTEGLPQHAPFDGILSTAAAPHVPENLLHQLKIGGRLVIPVGDRGVQTMLRITRISEQDFSTEEFQSFKFVPLIGKMGWSD